MSCKGMLLLAGVVLALGSSAEAGEWSHKAAVSYRETHDPNWVHLDGGQALHVSYSAIKWVEVERWKKGKRLFVAYKPETGAVLFDPGTGRHIPILSGLRRHPIDVILMKRMAAAVSPSDKRACLEHGKFLWDRELNRAWRAVLADNRGRRFTAQEKKEMIGAQRKWIEFRDAQIEAIRFFFGKRSRSSVSYQRRRSSMPSLFAEQQVIDLTRQQALRLGSLLDNH